MADILRTDLPTFQTFHSAPLSTRAHVNAYGMSGHHRPHVRVLEKALAS